MAEPDGYEPSAGGPYAYVGTVLLAASGFFFVNANETDLAVVLAFVCLGFGIYLIGVGAVARGTQVARRSTSPSVPPGLHASEEKP